MSKNSILKTQMVDDVPTLQPADVKNEMGSATIIDVRRPDEFSGELGHIKTAHLVTLGPELETFLTSNFEKLGEDAPLIFVCRSGGRSAHATQHAQEIGYKNIANMAGGMLLWNQNKFPIEK